MKKEGDARLHVALSSFQTYQLLWAGGRSGLVPPYGGKNYSLAAPTSSSLSMTISCPSGR
jgi:hypothetical protein